METLFENQYNRTEAIYTEMYQYLCFKTPARIFFDIIILLSFIANIILYVTGGEYEFAVFLLAPAFFGIQLYQYFQAVKLSLKRQAEVSPNENIYIHISVTDTEIVSKASTKAETSTPLTNVKKTIITKNLIMLKTRAKLIYIFPKDSFTKGSPDELCKFLKSKNVPSA